MRLHSGLRYWSIILVLTFLALALMSGANAEKIAGLVATVLPTNSGTPPVTVTGVSQPSLTSPPCVGLYVELQDNFNRLLMSGASVKGYPAARRIYRFATGEPITVTTVVLAFGDSEISVSTGPFSEEYTIKVVQAGSEGRVMGGMIRDIRTPGTYFVVNRSTPYFESFRIDKWYNLPRGGYNLLLTRRVWVNDVSYQVSGTVVYFEVQPQP
jgi:hypothetical protein